MQDWDERRQINPKVGFDTISVTEASDRSDLPCLDRLRTQLRQPAHSSARPAAYVTGSHSYKGRLRAAERGNGPTCNDDIDVNGNMNYTFRNGAPSSITLFATPIEQTNDINADLGMFAQDSWAMSRMTINYGIRYDYLHASVPAQHLAAGQFVPERNFAAVDNVPRWKDINPRIGVAYDLFGDGKTVVKGAVGRYISGGSLASNANPVNTSVNSANRTWNDINGNIAPGLRLQQPGNQRRVRSAVEPELSARSTRTRRPSIPKCSSAGACGRTAGA